MSEQPSPERADIVERLRAKQYGPNSKLHTEAADEIVRLRLKLSGATSAIIQLGEELAKEKSR